MRSFKRDNFTPTSKQQQVYSPNRTNPQNRPVNTADGPSLNKNRTQQIVMLHQEFEDLKRKIKEVENNNQKIIQKIHRQCNFKKKTPPQAYDVNLQTGPIVYYEKKDKTHLSQHSGMSIDESNKSDQSQFEFRQKKKPSKRGTVQSNNYLPHNNFTQSMQYNRIEQPKKSISKKYSKVSQNYQVDDGQSINNSQQMVQDEFQQQGQNMEYQMQSSHQTYNFLNELGGKNSGKKSSVMTSYPASQQHMTHTGFGSSNMNLSQQQPRAPSVYSPSIKQPRTSKQQYTIIQLEESLRTQKQKITFYQNELKSKQIEILNIRRDFNRLTTQLDSVQMIFQDNLEYFLQNVVKKRFFEMEKALKKNENRLRNISINIKDSYEEVKSNKLIKQHQLRRSNSRSKRDLSPLNNTSINNAINPSMTQSNFNPPQSAKIPRPSSSHGNGFYQSQLQPSIQPSQTSLQPVNPLEKRSRISQQSKKNKEFEQIVQKYEQMINSKREEISKLQLSKSAVEQRNQLLQKQLETKETEVKDIRHKLDELQRLMSETYNQIPIVHQKNQAKRPQRVSSADSNLLEDIDHLDHTLPQSNKFQQLCGQLKEQLSSKNQKITQLQSLINDYDERTGIYENQIKSYELKLKTCENKILKLENNITEIKNKNQSIKLQANNEFDKITRDKIQQQIKAQLTEIFNRQILIKEEQIQVIKNSQILLQKKIVEKDCQILSLNNKVKKIQGANDILNKKVEEYQKLLNHHNVSMDMNDSQFVSLLDKSICNDQPSTSKGLQQSRRTGSQKDKKIAISFEEIQSLESQLKESLEEILQLTKKIKSLEKSNQQKTTEINRLQEDNQLLEKEKYKLLQDVNSLKDEVKQLQEKLEEFQEQNSEFDNENQQKLDFGIDERRSADQSSRKLPQKRLSTIENGSPMFMRQQESVHLQQTIQRLQQQISTLKAKNSQLLTQYNSLKSQMLESSRNNITLKKDKQYLQETLSDRQQKYQKVKRQYEALKIKMNELQEQLSQKEEELRKQKDQNCAKIQQLQKQWHQFQQEINNNNNPDNLYDSSNPNNMDRSQILKSSRYNVSQSSLLLSSSIQNKNSQYLQQQNEYLTIKLKEAQATIQMHNMMEQKVLNEYKANVQKLRVQIKQKTKQCQNLKKELEMANDAKRRIQIMYESSKNYLAQSRLNINQNQNRQRQNSYDSSKKSIAQKSQQLKSNQPKDIQQNQAQSHELQMQEFPSYCEDKNNISLLSGQCELHNKIQPNFEQQNQEQRLYPYQRIIELQGQLKQAKDINKKLQQMQQELFKQIKLKEEEKKDLLKLIDQKNIQIQELQEIVELKQQNQSHLNILNSHLSNNKHSSQSRNNLSQRQSMHSHSSLRYSGITHARFPVQQPSFNTLQVMNASQMGHSERFQIQLSQTGSQMLDKSYVTNISEIFEKEEFPYQKVQLKRKQQIKLFQKTASYIKSLKDSINEKNKRIKVLEKKIESLKTNHQGHLSKQLQSKYEISTKNNDNEDNDIDVEFESVFKDYESVQLQRKKASHSKRYKTLEHQWKLALEENNVLSNQVQVLQEQLQKAQQQQNSILVMKDLYKQEIKKLLAKNESQTAYYEQLLAKEKKKVQQSQSVHNMQTIKQLFLKVMDSIIVMESQKSKKKRQEKKKQLEQFFKIFASLCAVDEAKKNAIIEGLKKMTLNIVLADEGRSTSKNKD